MKLIPTLLSFLLPLLFSLDVIIAKTQPMMINFIDEADEKMFDAASNWLKKNNVKVNTSINESYIKFILADMTPNQVAELKGKTEMGIENIEIDDMDLSEEEVSEL